MSKQESRKPVNMRLPGALVDALDRYAADRGLTRTAAVEAIVTDAIQAAERPTEATEQAGGTNVPGVDYRAVLEVLRESNSDLRRHASQLYALLGAKDQQIASLQLIVSQSQQLEMGRLAASTKYGSPETLRARIRRLFGIEGGNAHE